MAQATAPFLDFTESTVVFDIRLAWMTVRLFHWVLHHPVLYALEEWGG